MIRIKTQKVLHNLGNIFKMNTFLTVSPRTVFRTQLYLVFQSLSQMSFGAKVKWSFFAKIVNNF